MREQCETSAAALKEQGVDVLFGVTAIDLADDAARQADTTDTAGATPAARHWFATPGLWILVDGTRCRSRR